MSSDNNNDDTVAPGAAESVEHPTEVGLGISAYLSPHVPGFSGVSKARYSDFVVHEGKDVCAAVQRTDVGG